LFYFDSPTEAAAMLHTHTLLSPSVPTWPAPPSRSRRTCSARDRPTLRRMVALTTYPV